MVIITENRDKRTPSQVSYIRNKREHRNNYVSHKMNRGRGNNNRGRNQGTRLGFFKLGRTDEQVYKHILRTIQHEVTRFKLRLTPDGFVMVSKLVRLPIFAEFNNTTGVHKISQLCENHPDIITVTKKLIGEPGLAIRARNCITFDTSATHFKPANLEDYQNVYHKTNVQNLKHILNEGLFRFQRHNIALGYDGYEETDALRSADCIIFLDKEKCLNEKLAFFTSVDSFKTPSLFVQGSNGHITRDYFQKVLKIENGKVCEDKVLWSSVEKKDVLFLEGEEIKLSEIGSTVVNFPHVELVNLCRHEHNCSIYAAEGGCDFLHPSGETCESFFRNGWCKIPNCKRSHGRHKYREEIAVIDKKIYRLNERRNQKHERHIEARNNRGRGRSSYNNNWNHSNHSINNHSGGYNYRNSNYYNKNRRRNFYNNGNSYGNNNNMNYNSNNANMNTMNNNMNTINNLNHMNNLNNMNNTNMNMNQYNSNNTQNNGMNSQRTNQNQTMSNNSEAEIRDLTGVPQNSNDTTNIGIQSNDLQNNNQPLTMQQCGQDEDNWGTILNDESNPSNNMSRRKPPIAHNNNNHKNMNNRGFNNNNNNNSNRPPHHNSRDNNNNSNQYQRNQSHNQNHRNNSNDNNNHNNNNGSNKINNNNNNNHNNNNINNTNSNNNHNNSFVKNGINHNPNTNNSNHNNQRQQQHNYQQSVRQQTNNNTEFQNQMNLQRQQGGARMLAYMPQNNQQVQLQQYRAQQQGNQLVVPMQYLMLQQQHQQQQQQQQQEQTGVVGNYAPNSAYPQQMYYVAAPQQLLQQQYLPYYGQHPQPDNNVFVNDPGVHQQQQSQQYLGTVYQQMPQYVDGNFFQVYSNPHQMTGQEWNYNNNNNNNNNNNRQPPQNTNPNIPMQPLVTPVIPQANISHLQTQNTSDNNEEVHDNKACIPVDTNAYEVHTEKVDMSTPSNKKDHTSDPSSRVSPSAIATDTYPTVHQENLINDMGKTDINNIIPGVFMNTKPYQKVVISDHHSLE